MNEPLRPLLLTLLAVLGGLAALLAAALVVIRAVGELVERRRTRKRDELRMLILTALLGDPDEARPALSALRAREGRAWREVEQQAFSMLPKVKGDSHDALVLLLQSRGATVRACDDGRSRSLVRRSRGAYRLGALGDRESVSVLFGLLADRQFLVRRTAVRALGQIQDPLAVGPLLDAVTTDPALVRDVVAALQRIGPPAAPNLRRDLERLLAAGHRGHRGRRGALVATALGLHGDVAAVPLLVRALDGAQASLRAAAAAALGEIGVPGAVPALVEVLDDADTDVRVSAAAALGMIGDASAVPALAAALGGGAHVVDRAVAGALLQLGMPGLEALAAHPSPYATEALALRRMKAPA